MLGADAPGFATEDDERPIGCAVLILTTWLLCPWLCRAGHRPGVVRIGNVDADLGTQRIDGIPRSSGPAVASLSTGGAGGPPNLTPKASPPPPLFVTLKSFRVHPKGLPGPVHTGNPTSPATVVSPEFC